MMWNDFIRNSPKSPHETTKIAAGLFDATDSLSALDIGAGNGRDSRYLQEKGFRVHSIDMAGESKSHIEQHVGIRFEEKSIVGMKLDRYDLINASLVFPFLEKSDFDCVWLELDKSIQPNGVICGHLFGLSDWKVQSETAWGLCEDELTLLLASYDVKYLMEFNKVIEGTYGVKKRKHNFSFVAQAF